MTPTTVGEDEFIPLKDEIVWVRGNNSDGTPGYIITSNKMRSVYFLYAYEKGAWKKIAKARSPITFEGRVNVVTGQEMSKSFCGKKKYQRGPGSLRHLFAY